MFRDVILLSVFIIVLFIIWVVLKLNIRVRRVRAEQIKKLKLANYVTFVSNFKRGEEAEELGDRETALHHYRRALINLKEEDNPDELTLETIAEVESKIAVLNK